VDAFTNIIFKIFLILNALILLKEKKIQFWGEKAKA
jgi:hypothetical protein